MRRMDTQSDREKKKKDVGVNRSFINELISCMAGQKDLYWKKRGENFLYKGYAEQS